MSAEIKVSDYIADQLFRSGCDVIFGVSGGASLHLLDSIQRHPSLKLITVHHEQTVAMAAEAYSRITGNIGVGIVTSGPGATNLVTGVAGAFYDSVRCLFITGQVSTFRKSTGLGVRQYGFQETPTADIFEHICKFVKSVGSSREVPTVMAEAVLAASAMRQGPVVIDIPDDIQRQFIEDDFCDSNRSVDFHHRYIDKNTTLAKDIIESLKCFLKDSLRPVVICGSGIAMSRCDEEFLKVLDFLEIPVALTWGSKSLVPSNRQYLLGTFGTHGSRIANHVIQQADLIISFGSRLDTKATGSPPDTFAPLAKKIMFDIDSNEFRKFNNKGLLIDQFFKIDFKDSEFKTVMKIMLKLELERGHWRNWQKYCQGILNFSETIDFSSKGIDPYVFVRELSNRAPNQCRVIIDTGCTIAWTMQAWSVSSGQSLFHDFNNTAMGWSIPATLASVLVLDDVPTICLVGDGSLMMSIGDLATITSQPKPSLIFLLNNSGYSMIKQTQEQWFESRYFASDTGTGIHFPDFKKLAESFGFTYYQIGDNEDLARVLSDKSIFGSHTFVEVMINPEARVIPQNRFGQPIDVMEPENKLLPYRNQTQDK